jgi:hypothetical protein
MADEFRKILCAAVAHQPQSRFGVECHPRYLTVLEPKTHDQIGLAVVSRAEFRADDGRAG